MIDIHSHILPRVDDGSTSISMTKELLLSAVEQGITDIVCTPHHIKLSQFTSSFTEIEKKFNELCSEVKSIPVNLHLGSEVFFENGLVSQVTNHKVHTLANSRYLLIETNFLKSPKDILDEIYDCVVSGIIPILAHPERYKYIQADFMKAATFVKEGCLIQINADSLTGNHGKKERQTAFDLIEANLAHFVASDAHNLSRNIRLKEAYRVVLEKYDRGTAHKLFQMNPQSVLNNQEIIVEIIDESKRKSFFRFSKK